MGRLLTRRTCAGAVVSVVLAIVAAAVGCSEPPRPPSEEIAERAWRALQEDPTASAWKTFRAANLEAARLHGESHDRLGVQFQVRAIEAQAMVAQRTSDPAEAGPLAYEVLDAVDDLERKDLFRVYDDVLPGAAERLRRARQLASTVAR